MLAACASGYTKIDSKLQTDDVPIFKRMFIVLDVESKFFTKEIEAGLQKSLVSSLSSCGIVSTVYVKDPLDIKPEQTYAKKFREFQADSLISIVRTAGHVLVGRGGNEADFDLMLRIYKLNPKVEVWTAKSDVSILTANPFVNNMKTGEKLGLEFFEKMRKDNVICKSF
jgi:hypothetical protein